MGDNNLKAALAKHLEIKAKKAKTLQTNKSAALDKHLEIQAKRSINRTAALNKWRTLSGFGTKPQNIKHFPAQRQKK